MIPMELKLDFDINGNIINSDSIIRFIKNIEDKNLLISYLNNLMNNPKLEGINTSTILIALKEQIVSLSKDENTLEILNKIVDNIEIGQSIPEAEMNYLTNFLNICINNEEQGIINKDYLQKLFDRVYNYIINSGNYINEAIKNIIDRKTALLNKASSEGMSESNSYVKSLTPPKARGHALTVDEDPLSFKSTAAFVATTIILEGSLVLGLILGLIALVNK